jgi:hypothetical protein
MLYVLLSDGRKIGVSLLLRFWTVDEFPFNLFQGLSLGFNYPFFDKYKSTNTNQSI